MRPLEATFHIITEPPHACVKPVGETKNVDADGEEVDDLKPSAPGTSHLRALFERKARPLSID